MIVKSKRVRARGQGLKRTLQHLANGDDNDAVELVAGTVADLEDARADALRFAREYCVRHWIVAPAQRISREQLFEFVDRLAFEFSFDPAKVVIWEHTKARATDDGCDQHFHICVREVDAITGGVLSSSHDYARHEKLARVSELAWGHALVPGRHTAAVAAAVELEGGPESAAILRRAVSIDHAQSFDEANHQRLKRAGYDLPRLRGLIADALFSSVSRDQFDAKLAALGLRLQPGDKPDTPIIETIDDSILVGSLARLSRLRKAALAERLKFYAGCSVEGKAHDSSRHIRSGSANLGSDGTAVESCQKRRQPGSARPDRRDDYATGTGGGRNRAAPLSAGEFGIPARRSGGGKSNQIGRARLKLSAYCSHRQSALLDLLGEARRATLSPLERVTSALDDLVECETRACDPRCPSAPASLLAARRGVELATERLRKLETSADRIEERLSGYQASPIWRWLLPQPAESNQREVLALRVEQVRRDVLAAHGRYVVAVQSLKEEESEYRRVCARHEALLLARRAQADARIAAVQTARKFLEENPRAAFGGMQHLWRVVAGIQKTRAEWGTAPDADVSDDWSLLPIFDLWGKPYLPPGT